MFNTNTIIGASAGETEVLVDRTAGTAIGNMTGEAGLAAASDGDTTQTLLQSAGRLTTSSPLGIAYIGKDWGAGVTKKISKFKAYGTSDNGFRGGSPTNSVMTLTLQGSTDNFSASIVDLGNGSIADADSIIFEVTASDISTKYRYHRIKMTSADSNDWHRMAELEFWKLV